MDHQHFVQGYQGERLALPEKFKGIVRWATDWYVNYLRALTDDHVNGIPIEWRLTEDEEFRILSLMEREKIELPHILEIRKELLLSET